MCWDHVVLLKVCILLFKQFLFPSQVILQKWDFLPIIHSIFNSCGWFMLQLLRIKCAWCCCRRLVFKMSPWASYSFRVRARNMMGMGEPSKHTHTLCRSAESRPYRNPYNVRTIGEKTGYLIIKWEVSDLTRSDLWIFSKWMGMLWLVHDSHECHQDSRSLYYLIQEITYMARWTYITVM